MNYEDGIKVLPAFEKLKNQDLINSTEWRITQIALLPIVENTLLAYSVPLDWVGNQHWLANGVNHEALYKRTGIYYNQDGTHHQDDLTFFALLKKHSNPLYVEYKCVLLTKLIEDREISPANIPSYVLPYLSDRSK